VYSLMRPTMFKTTEGWSWAREAWAPGLGSMLNLQLHMEPRDKQRRRKRDRPPGDRPAGDSVKQQALGVVPVAGAKSGGGAPAGKPGPSVTKHLEPPRSSSSVVEWLLTRAAGKPSAQALNGMLTRLSKPVVLDAVKGTSRSHKARANTRLSRNGVGACGPAHRAAARASPGGGALRLGCSWSALEPLRASWREYVHTEMAGVAGGGASGGGQAGSSTAGGGAPRPAVSITSLSRDEAVARRVGSLDLHGCPVKGTGGGLGVRLARGGGWGCGQGVVASRCAR
jgi:hypothetical protein